MRSLIHNFGKRRRNSLVVLTLALVAMASLTANAAPLELSQESSSAAISPVSAIVGDWRGTSTCVVRESACRDEDSLYHFSAVADKPDAVSLKADKIVEGKPVTMGTGDCGFDPAKSQITCPLPSASLSFHVNGKEMTGTMTLSNGTLWRRLTLNKVK